MQAGAFATAVALFLLANPSMSWAADSDVHSATTPTPVSSSSSSPQSDEDWEEAHHQQENFEQRYGPDRDIVAPPLLVKQSKSGSAKYITKPIKINRPSSSGFQTSIPVGPEMSPRAFNATRNQPVINTISVRGYSTPAEEFAAKAYLGMGMLAVVALVLGGVVAVRYRNRGNAMDDFDLFDQPPGTK
jgi:hypothetical protein